MKRWCLSSMLLVTIFAGSAAFASDSLETTRKIQDGLIDLLTGELSIQGPRVEALNLKIKSRLGELARERESVPLKNAFAPWKESVETRVDELADHFGRLLAAERTAGEGIKAIDILAELDLLFINTHGAPASADVTYYSGTLTGVLGTTGLLLYGHDYAAIAPALLAVVSFFPIAPALLGAPPKEEDRMQIAYRMADRFWEKTAARWTHHSPEPLNLPTDLDSIQARAGARLNLDDEEVLSACEAWLTAGATPHS